MDVDLYERTLQNAGKVVHSTKPEQLGDPTPCTNWDVRALLNHLVGGCAAIAAGAKGEKYDFYGGGDHLGDDHSEAFDRAAKAAVEAFRTPGAAEATFTMSWGDTPGAITFGLGLADGVVHGWDLAQATGQRVEIEDEAAKTVYQMVTSMLEPKGEWPRRDQFGEPIYVPDDAPIADRLLGYLGRDPQRSSV